MIETESGKVLSRKFLKHCPVPLVQERLAIEIISSEMTSVLCTETFRKDGSGGGGVFLSHKMSLFVAYLGVISNPF